MQVRRVRLQLSLPLCLLFTLLLTFGAGIAQDKSSTAEKPAEPQSYRSGLKSIVIPQPTADLSEVGSDYRVLLDSLVPDTNRLLAAFLTAEDSTNIRSGVAKPFGRYAMVENLRRAEFADINADLFKQVSAGAAAEVGAALDSSMKDPQVELNHKLKAMLGSDKTITLDKPLQLGAFFSKPNACSFGMIESVSAAGNSTKMVVGMTILRAQNRLLYAYVVSPFKDEESVQWVRKISEQWADAILKANEQ